MDNIDENFSENDGNRDERFVAGSDLDSIPDIDTPAVAPIPFEHENQLQVSDMRAWLTQYKVKTRSSTVTGAFVAALLPYDNYNEEQVRNAMRDLEQDPNSLVCVYCGGIPTTWDHLINSVQNRQASGPGHRIYNLVPCCARCNSSKGGKTFTDWIRGYQNQAGNQVPGTLRVNDERREYLIKLLSNYQAKCPQRSATDMELERKLMTMRDRIIDILSEADALVAEARRDN